MEKDDHSQYLMGVKDRVKSLSDEDKAMLTRFRDTKEGALIAKIVGPDIAEIAGSPTPVASTPKKRTMSPIMPQQQPQAKPQGLAARPQR